MEHESEASPAILRNDNNSSHLILISEHPAQWRRAVRAFLREGLLRGEPCLCLHALYSRPSVCCFLDAVGVDTTTALKRGLLSFVPAHLVFCQGGEFSPAACLDRLVKAWQHHTPGPSGPIRVVADMNWAADTRLDHPRLLVYEDLINSRLIPSLNLPLNLVCHYDRVLFPPRFLDRVVARHQGRVAIPGPLGAGASLPVPLEGGDSHLPCLVAL